MKIIRKEVPGNYQTDKSYHNVNFMFLFVIKAHVRLCLSIKQALNCARAGSAAACLKR